MKSWTLAFESYLPLWTGSLTEIVSVEWIGGVLLVRNT
jgi:hypothetical protein